LLAILKGKKPNLKSGEDIGTLDFEYSWAGFGCKLVPGLGVSREP
jgi:hypothetical protein